MSQFHTAGEPVVTVLLKNCHQYRVAFFEHLREILTCKGITLRVVVGGGLAEDAAKGDIAQLDWAEQRSFRTVDIKNTTLLWQPGFDLARSSDLIITEQASKQLFNIPLAFGQRLFRTRHAFWGHGKNFQASVEGDRGEGLKAQLTKRAHWFFAYNNVSAQAAVEFGMAPDRVTPVMNTTDTTHLRDVRSALPADTPRQVRSELGLTDGPVGIYMGGLYSLKRPQFLVDTVQQIRDRCDDFQMIVIGGGSEESTVREAASADWIHYLGPIYGDERVRIASIAQLQLMPGLLGLNVVDAFALGIPTVTTDIDYHSPEIEYLIDGVNGLVVRNATPATFADAVVALLDDEDRLTQLRVGAELAGQELSVEDMAQRFADGVVQALLVE